MVITNAKVYDVDGCKELDVKIVDGKIVELGTSLTDEEIIDAKGAYLLPALVDKNVSLLDATLNAKNINAIAAEAKKGGVGRVVLNPHSTPAIDNEIVLEYAKNSIKDIDDVQIDLMLNTLQDDLSLSNIAILLKKGASSPYMSTIAKNNIAIKIAEYVKMYDTTLHCKAEDNSLIHSGVMFDGDVSSNLGLSGIPELSEVLHVSRMIEIARYFDIKILFKSIASPRSIELISKAKQEGVQVSCEVSIHHLMRCDESCRDFNTIAKINPPLASKDDMHKLQELLRNGEIDRLTTLHQPNSPVNKEVAFDDAAYGCSALGDALPLYYTKLVKTEMIDMETLLKLTTDNGKIEVGASAELVLFDPTQSYTVNNVDSLYNFEELFGIVTPL
ncbi:dihydroorotase [Sulfurimonas marina]|uniref:Dihydroorotase n=1 Tax=Sulfurimonas marina TaxID=2590551 RepID=A0A7M1AUJ1_9BACT|nr:dihydroorotase [Sulfurimonas marina]QOP41101.1 dihydroorotase [Sulfurimonas marina]